MADVVRRLGRLITSELESDADLLARFAADRDGPAFAALVRRHGPMVLAVCRRVLRHRQDAEDAFQATFLVLTRRASAVKPRSHLGSWLYGVAYRTALGARRVAAARKAREAKAAAARAEETSPDADLGHELREALDRELAALPDVYQAAVVACDLEGLSRRDAAVRLGWTEGTLSSRLARARALLTRRLSRYGLVLPVVGLSVADPVSVAGELADATVRIGTLVATGEAVVAAPVAVLVEGTMRAILVTKFKTLAAAVVVGCAVVAVAAAGWRANADAGGQTGQPKTGEPAGRAARDADKERIAELERERDLLRKEVRDLRDRMVEVERRFDAERSERAAPTERKKNVAATDPLPRFPNGRPTPGGADPVRPAPEVSPELPRRSNTSQNLPRLAPEPAASTPAEKASVSVYHVDELVGDEKDGEALVKVLKATVSPRSWGVDAGVEYLPGRKVLVVRQTANGQDEVAALLHLLMKHAAAPPRK